MNVTTIDITKSIHGANFSDVQKMELLYRLVWATQRCLNLMNQTLEVRCYSPSTSYTIYINGGRRDSDVYQPDTTEECISVLHNLLAKYTHSLEIFINEAPRLLREIPCLNLSNEVSHEH